MLLLILAAAEFVIAITAILILTAPDVPDWNHAADDPRDQRRDEQRLPMPCTCGMRRFCRGGCGAVVDVSHGRGGKL